MSEPSRPTQPVVGLVSLRKSRPFPGQRVLALTEGGKLVEVVWSETNASTYFAWMPYPRTPPDVKEELSEHYFRNARDDFRNITDSYVSNSEWMEAND